MPVYAYRCKECENDFEVRQSFSDDALTQCQICDTEGSIFRVIQPAGVVFKGSGFYVTDTRGKNPASPANAPETSSNGSSDSSANGTSSDNGASASSDNSKTAKSSSDSKSSDSVSTASSSTSSDSTAAKKAS